MLTIDYVNIDFLQGSFCHIIAVDLMNPPKAFSCELQDTSTSFWRAKELEAQAPAKIIELIDKFDRDQDIYRSSQYNETELRTEFINPFFEALGWDVYHKQECRADKREVKEEDAIEVEGKIKNPDYSFRLFDEKNS